MKYRVGKTKVEMVVALVAWEQEEFPMSDEEKASYIDGLMKLSRETLESSYLLRFETEAPYENPLL